MSADTKPRVFSRVWIHLPRREQERRWHVSFTDDCGCVYEEDFATHPTAFRFARHVALGGSRWEFTE